MKVLFIHLPHASAAARLSTMPFALNAVTMLAAQGAEVTLCLWERDASEYRSLQQQHPNLTILTFSEGTVARFSMIFSVLGPFIYTLQVALRLRSRFDFVFAVGQKALVVGNAVSVFFGGKLIYLNEEFPSSWGTGFWLRWEKKAGKRTAALIVPDECRKAVLLKELEVSSGHPIFVMPNAPPTPIEREQTDLFARLNLPNGASVVFFAGTVGDWAQIPETLLTLSTWPDSMVLVIHTRGGLDVTQYRKSLEHLRDYGRVFWSFTPLTQAQLNGAITNSFCTLALYRNLGPNIELMGMSAGKVMRSIVCGTPVIASRYESLGFIEKEGLGVLVGHPEEIPQALASVQQRHDEMKANCARFAAAKMNMAEHWRIFADAVMAH